MSRRNKLRKASSAVNQRKLDLFYSSSFVNKEALEAEQAYLQKSMNKNDSEIDNSHPIASHKSNLPSDFKDKNSQMQSDVVIQKAVESASLMQTVHETAQLDTLAIHQNLPSYIPDLECAPNRNGFGFDEAIEIEQGSTHGFEYDVNAINEIAQPENDSDDSADWIVEDVKYAICCGNLWYPWLVLQNNEGLESWIPIIDRIDGIWSLERYCTKCRKNLDKSAEIAKNMEDPSRNPELWLPDLWKMVKKLEIGENEEIEDKGAIRDKGAIWEKSRVFKQNQPGVCVTCSSEPKNPNKSKQKDKMEPKEILQHEENQNNCKSHGLYHSECQNCRRCVACPNNEVCLSDYVILICIESPLLALQHQQTNPLPKKTVTDLLKTVIDGKKLSLYCMLERVEDILSKIMELNTPHAFILFPEDQICSRPVMTSHLTAFLHQLLVDYNTSQTSKIPLAYKSDPLSQTNKAKLVEESPMGDKVTNQSIEFSEKFDIQQVIEAGNAIGIEYLTPDYVQELKVEKLSVDPCAKKPEEMCYSDKCDVKYHNQSEYGFFRLSVYDPPPNNQDRFQLPNSQYKNIPHGILTEIFEQLAHLLIDQFEQLTSMEWSVFQYTPDYGSNDMEYKQQANRNLETSQDNSGGRGPFRKIDFKNMNNPDSACTTKDGPQKINGMSIKGEILTISGYHVYLNDPMIQFDYRPNWEGYPIDAKGQPISGNEELMPHSDIENITPSLIHSHQGSMSGKVLDLRDLIGRKCLQNQ